MHKKKLLNEALLKLDEDKKNTKHEFNQVETKLNSFQVEKEAFVSELEIFRITTRILSVDTKDISEIPVKEKKPRRKRTKLNRSASDITEISPDNCFSESINSSINMIQDFQNISRDEFTIEEKGADTFESTSGQVSKLELTIDSDNESSYTSPGTPERNLRRLK